MRRVRWLVTCFCAGLKIIRAITDLNIDIEFKSARSGMPGSFWVSYSVMVNTQGGTIVLGVTEGPTGLV